MLLDSWLHFDDVEWRDICLLVRCSPDWQWNPPPLQSFDFWFVLDGMGTMAWGDEQADLRPGSCFVFPPGTRPNGRHDHAKPLKVFASHFLPRLGGKRLSPKHWPEPDAPLLHQFRDLPYATGLAQRALDWSRRDDSANRTMWAKHLMSLLALVDEERGAAPPLDAALHDLLDEIRFSPNTDWTVDVMAERLHLSRSQLTRRFQHAIAQSPAEFVIAARLSRACEYLRDSNLTLEAIAEQVGYRDVFYFAKQFREKMGLPPGQWRKGKQL